jgi:protein-tyrosine phosphatase
MAETIALARSAAENGITTIVATPHVSASYRNDAATIERLSREVAVQLSNEGVPVEILIGAEVALPMLVNIDREELGRLALGGGRWMLIECPFTPHVPGIEPMLARVRDWGFAVLLAHPERCPAFQRDLSLLRRLVAAGALVSVTAGSLVGRFGRDVERVSIDLFQQGLVHNVASDAHDTLRRPPSIMAELVDAGLAGLAPHLTEAVPRAILGRALPLAHE